MSRRSFFRSAVQAYESLHLLETAEISEGDTAVLSINGTAKDLFGLIASAIEMGHWDPSGVLSLGFKNEFDGAQGHLLFLATDRTNDLSALKAAVPASVFEEFLYHDHFYGHEFSALGDEVDLGAFDKGFEQMFEADEVFRDMFRTLFVGDGSPHNTRTLRGSSTSATSLLLIGGQSKRVVVAAHAGKVETFKTIPTPTSGPACYGVVDESAFVVAERGNSTLFGIHAIQLSIYLEGQIEVLPWRNTHIDQGTISEIALVDGVHGKILLTLSDSEHRYVPVDVRFSQNELQLTIDTRNATPVARDHDQPPIVRLNAQGTGGRGNLAHVDREGLYALTYRTIEAAIEMHPPFARTVDSVTGGGWGIPVEMP